MGLSTQQAPKANLIAFMAEAHRRGYHVGEHPLYGGVKPVHTRNSWHYDGLAADVNWRGPDERSKLINLIPLAEAYGLGLIFARDGIVGAAANHQGHLHVDCGSWSNYGRGDVRAKVATRKPATNLLLRGSVGSTVETLQAGLNRVFPAYSKLATDGKYGPRTEDVVQEFQRRAGLADDGVVGVQTRTALEGYGIDV
jgi:hypothetical protein